MRSFFVPTRNTEGSLAFSHASSFHCLTLAKLAISLRSNTTITTVINNNSYMYLNRISAPLQDIQIYMADVAHNEQNKIL